MSTFRFGSAFLRFGTLALLANGCGQEIDASLPQNEAFPKAPEGIIFIGPDGTLPAGFTIQSLTTTEQNQMLTAVNAVRAQSKTCGSTTYPAAPALALNSKLINAAEGHAADMAAKNYFSHTSLDGTAFSTRITNAGYSWSTVGENIAAGYSTITATVGGWYASAGHCANFMNKNFVQVGFGKGNSASSRYKYYWVADLAKPR